MIKVYETFDELVLSYAELFSALSNCQDEVAPQVFNALVDSCFKMYNADLKLFMKKNNYKQAFKEAKFSSILHSQKWKGRLREQVYLLHPELRPSLKKNKISLKERFDNWKKRKSQIKEKSDLLS